MNLCLSLRDGELKPMGDTDAAAMSNAEVVAMAVGASLEIVLPNPAYISARHDVELRTRRDRKKMAAALFEELAGAQGVGSWSIVSAQGSVVLYLLALDPLSLDARRLQSLHDDSIAVDVLKSALSAVPIGLRAERVLRVQFEGESMQIALALFGRWVFARRVDAAGGEPLASLRSTMAHLRAQAYLSDGQAFVWQLIAAPEQTDALAPLWQAVTPEMPEMPQPEQWVQERQGIVIQQRCTVLSVHPWAAAAVPVRHRRRAAHALVLLSLLALCAFVPQWVVLGVPPPPLVQPAEDAFPQDLQHRYWLQSALSAQAYASPDSVAALMAKLLGVVEADPALEWRELELTAARSLLLKGRLLTAGDDPLLRMQALDGFVRELAQQLPRYTLELQRSDALVLGLRNSSMDFSVSLERSDETR